MSAEKDKFETEELPLILAALKTARDAGAAGTVTVSFSNNGGVMTVIHETKKRFK